MWAVSSIASSHLTSSSPFSLRVTASLVQKQTKINTFFVVVVVFINISRRLLSCLYYTPKFS